MHYASDDIFSLGLWKVVCEIAASPDRNHILNLFSRVSHLIPALNSIHMLMIPKIYISSFDYC